jgi:hypothetical protein
MGDYSLPQQINLSKDQKRQQGKVCKEARKEFE